MIKMAITTHTHLIAFLVRLSNKKLMPSIVSNHTDEARQWFGTIRSMFDFYQKRKLRGVINSRVTQVILVILILLMGYSAYGRYEIAMEMQERREIAEAEVQALEERRATLEEQVEYLSSERGQEAELRRQFDVALPGEQVVVIVEEESEEVEILPLSTSTNESNKKWYQFWR
jgi:cell division protein FtsB